MRFGLNPWQDDDTTPMAPMIDMVFLLLIFFMAASHLNQLERVEIEVPEAAHAVSPRELLDRRTVTIREDEAIYLGNRPSSLEEVAAAVKKELAQVPGLKVYLRADKRVRHRRVRDVMQACAEGGAAEIIFAAYESP